MTKSHSLGKVWLHIHALLPDQRQLAATHQAPCIMPYQRCERCGRNSDATQTQLQTQLQTQQMRHTPPQAVHFACMRTHQTPATSHPVTGCLKHQRSTIMGQHVPARLSDQRQLTTPHQAPSIIPYQRCEGCGCNCRRDRQHKAIP